jgi:2-oxo-4-hydroxy-4-carboxy-5-ureidoimidazoline decarboxylase
MSASAISELNRLPDAAFTREIASLFEGAPRFLARLAAARPFDSDAAMLTTAREIARTMPEPDQIELLDAHPRLGADPASVSLASFEEQGYDEAHSNDAVVLDELAMLNEVYEGRFGFRCVVFVAGRPLASIAPLIEAAMRNDRGAELGRGLDEVIDIAADRLDRQRGDDRDGEEAT